MQKFKPIVFNMLTGSMLCVAVSIHHSMGPASLHPAHTALTTPPSPPARALHPPADHNVQQFPFLQLTTLWVLLQHTGLKHLAPWQACTKPTAHPVCILQAAFGTE